MVRLKKPIDYVNWLILNPNTDLRKLGENLQKQYRQWTKSLSLEHLFSFLKTIQENKNKIGAPQLFGKFRAYSFEEYIYRLIQAKVFLPESLNVYWGEKALTWKKDAEEYGMELDVLIGKRLNQSIEPAAAVEAKVELDASRLKTALATFLLLRRCYPEAKCFLVYVFGEIDPLLLKLTRPWIKGIHQFSLEKDEGDIFIKAIQEIVRQF